jgi:hypothetical protein
MHVCNLLQPDDKNKCQNFAKSISQNLTKENGLQELNSLAMNIFGMTTQQKYQSLTHIHKDIIASLNGCKSYEIQDITQLFSRFSKVQLNANQSFMDQAEEFLRDQNNNYAKDYRSTMKKVKFAQEKSDDNFEIFRFHLEGIREALNDEPDYLVHFLDFLIHYIERPDWPSDSLEVILNRSDFALNITEKNVYTWETIKKHAMNMYDYSHRGTDEEVGQYTRWLIDRLNLYQIDQQPFMCEEAKNNIKNVPQTMQKEQEIADLKQLIKNLEEIELLVK